VAGISNKAGWSIAIAVSLVLAATLAGWVHAGGPLDPPGPPGVTMKSLSEVEPRTPISALPYTISQPGSYYLTGNVSVNTAIDGITVHADDVTIDLNGFELNGNGEGANAITEGAASPARRNWRVYNGSIVGWGYAFDGLDVSNGQIDHVNASGIRAIGLRLGAGARVSDCSVEGSGGAGTAIAIGAGSSVKSCSTRAFFLGISAGSQSTVTRCNVTGSTNGVNAQGSTIESCTIAAIGWGIIVGAGQNAILGNQIDMTLATSASSCGIWAIPGVNGTAIDGNRVTNSPIGVCLSPSSGTTATRNSFYNMTVAVFTGYLGDDVPAAVVAASATNPLANICASPPGTCVSTP
jgi:parallel beta-helix repeat protein